MKWVHAIKVVYKYGQILLVITGTAAMSLGPKRRAADDNDDGILYLRTVDPPQKNSGAENDTTVTSSDLLPALDEYDDLSRKGPDDPLDDIFDGPPHHKRPRYRNREADQMGNIAETVKHWYESGQMEALTFTERQQMYKEFIDSFPHTRPENIAGQLLAGAAKSLFIGKPGKVFLNDVLHYIAMTFYKPVPSWVSGKYDEDLHIYPTKPQANGAELIRHLQTRFSCSETLERYELADGTDYDVLWSDEGVGDCKREIARLITSSAATPGLTMGYRRFDRELRVLPELVSKPVLFPGAGLGLPKWSCTGAESFSLEINGKQSAATGLSSTKNTFIHIFNRPERYRAVLLPLTKITAESPPRDVQLWLHECGCTRQEGASVHAQIISGTNFAAMTAFDFQTRCGFTKPRAKALHAALKTQTLRAAIKIANEHALDNFTEDYDTPPWKAEIMLLLALCTERADNESINDVICSYLKLSTSTRKLAIDAVLVGVTPIMRDPDVMRPYFQKLKLRRVEAHLPGFPDIISHILNDKTISNSKIVDMQVSPQPATIMEMLDIYHPGKKELNEDCFPMWINPELFELISDWYFNCALTATVPAQTIHLAKWPNTELPWCEQWLQSLLGHKVSLEPAGGAAGSPSYKGVVPIQALATWDLDDYDAYEFKDISTFLHAMFDPLRFHRKGAPVQQDAVSLIYKGLLSALDALEGDATPPEILAAMKAPLADKWVLNEYICDSDSDDGGRYRTYLFLQSDMFSIIYCGSVEVARWAINKLQYYHNQGTTIANAICEQLLEIWNGTEQARGSAPTSGDAINKFRDAMYRWLVNGVADNWDTSDGPAREHDLWVWYLRHGDGESANYSKMYRLPDITEALCTQIEFAMAAPLTEPLEISKEEFLEVLYHMQPSNNTDDIQTGKRLDFTIPGTPTTVHFSREADSLPWCVRLYTPTDIETGSKYQNWEQTISNFGQHIVSVSSLPPLPELFSGCAFNKYVPVLILGQQYAQDDIIQGVADCTIWEYVTENVPFYTAEIEERFKTLGENYDPAVVETIRLQVREMIITPMFVEAAKATLHLEEKFGKVYMLASFTDLAL